MKTQLTATLIAFSSLAAACGGANATTGTAPAGSNPTAAKSGGASEVVKSVYDSAIKRDCAAIPPMLTDDFRKAVGTSKDSLDALCDSITDSGKVTSAAIIGENLNGDAGTIRVKQTLKDGSSIDKEERVKKSTGKWLMDS